MEESDFYELFQCFTEKNFGKCFPGCYWAGGDSRLEDHNCPLMLQRISISFGINKDYRVNPEGPPDYVKYQVILKKTSIFSANDYMDMFNKFSNIIKIIFDVNNPDTEFIQIAYEWFKDTSCSDVSNGILRFGHYNINGEKNLTIEPYLRALCKVLCNKYFT